MTAPIVLHHSRFPSSPMGAISGRIVYYATLGGTDRVPGQLWERVAEVSR